MALQVWLPLNGNTKNLGLLDELTVSGATYAAGKLDAQALNAGSVQMTAEQTAKVLNNKAVSIAFWVYVDKDAGSTGNTMFFGSDNMNSTYGRRFALFNYSTSNDLHWSWQHSVGGTVSSVAGGVLSNVIPTRDWVHVCVTYQNPTGKIYINGTLKQTFSGAYNADDFNFTCQVIHNSTTHRMQDFRLYDHCLSEKEVREISKGLCLHYKLSKNVNESTTNLLPAAVYNHTGGVGAYWGGVIAATTYDGYKCFSVTNNTSNNYGDGFIANAATISDGVVYTYSGDIFVPSGKSFRVGMRTSGGGNGFNTTIVGNGAWQHFSKTFTATSSYNGSIEGSENSAYSDSTVYYIKNLQLEQKDHETPFVAGTRSNSIEPDVSGFNHNGTLNGDISCCADTSKYLCSMQSPNGTDYVKSSLSMALPQATFSFWICPSSSNGGYSIVTSNYGNPSSGFWIASNCESQGLWFYNGGYARCSGTLTNDTWYHGCLTYNAGVFKWYKNGVLNSTTDLSSKGTTIPLTNICVGNSYTGTSWNTKQYGKISDFRIYATCLSDADVLDLYHTAASIDNNGNLFVGEVVE